MGEQPHQHHRWREQCSALEDRLGYTRGVLYEEWEITVRLRELRSICRMSREVHEEMAFLNVIEQFDKAGAIGD